MAYKVFLSHSSKDASWVNWIRANAHQIEIEVYLHEFDPQPGQSIAAKLRAAIQSSDALVVLLTGSSESSAYVHQEIGTAKALNKPVIPLVQPGVRKESLAMLDGLEYIPFDFTNPQQALQTLLPHLQKLKQAKENQQQAVLFGFIAIVALAALLSGGKQ